MKDKKFSFETLIGSIQQVHAELAAQASRAVNLSLTLRNWLIGAYIREYELRGSDRAEYGDRLIETLSSTLRDRGMTRCDRRELYRYVTFYTTYPQIVESVTPKFLLLDNELIGKVETLSPQSAISGAVLVQKLSFSHLAELLNIDEPLKRSFYEIECIRGGWSVRELKRQIGSLYYERTGLSLNKGKLAELTQAAAEKSEPVLAIRDPYVFEFLGLKPAEVMSESHLEDRLINQLEAFSHENIGQLNTYVSWYRKNMMTAGDNPPVGILLCTGKNHVLAEYALAGMDNSLFVSKYQLELPDKESMQRFLEEKLKEEALESREFER